MKPLVQSLVPAIVLVTMCALHARAVTLASGIEGEVLNATCPGPCSEPPEPLPLYEGKNLVVTVRSMPDQTIVARLYPAGGRFALGTDPGRYRVRARIRNSGAIQGTGATRKTGTFSCWQGSAQKIVVEEGAIAHLSLRVQNVCVL